jgi:hypothetical protein
MTMKKIYFLIFIFLITNQIFGQYYIYKEKATIIKDFDKYKQKQKASFVFLATDTSISYLMTDSVNQKEFSFKYYFDKDGICNIQEQVSYCDSCLQLWLKSAKKDARYNYRKVGENTWFAKYKKGIVMQTKMEADKFYLTWSKLYLTRREYKAILYSNNN